MAQWLECEFTDLKVRGSSPTSTSRLPLSRLGRPGIIPALVLPLGCMAARHRKCVTAERFFSEVPFGFCGIRILFIFTPLSFERPFSCPGVIIPSSSAVHIQWPCRVLNPGHLTCEASVLPLHHQRTLDASDVSERVHASQDLSLVITSVTVQFLCCPTNPKVTGRIVD
ncbi:hypothetical protein CSKR_108305 [Clonorchis sinensis]|uniref:Uncharacterized protein n=1 Tax=Clonorchis sinensis TaxID=79923 RepID=A0A3R7JRL6_CLOSI|nr:hypothetical protein CSKR_108305 [Clonorchis sinensis]